MDLFKTYKLSPTKCRIIECLFVYRALNAYQLYFLLDPENIPLTYPHFSWEQTDNPRMHSLYNQLTQMLKSGVIYVTSKLDNNSRVFSLTEDGLSVAYSLLNIPEIEGYQRTGWDNDHGYFPYDLYRAPKDRLLRHHSLGIDFNVLMKLLAIKHDFSYDFIDNRYSSVEFSVSDDSNNSKMSVKKFRPDGEFIIRTKDSGRKFHCWLEFDMGTERGNLLNDKFLKYSQYLNYISQGLDRFSLSNSIPDTIFFITTANQSIWSRWQNVFRNYMNTIGQWSTYVNMYLGNLESLENLILSYLNESKLYKTNLNKNLRPLLEDVRFRGQPKPSKSVSGSNQGFSFCFVFENEMREIGWEPYLTVTQRDPHSSQVYLYIKYEEYETGGISKAIDFASRFESLDSMKRINAKEVIPVLLFSEKIPHALDFIGCENKEAFDRVFDKYLWHDVLSNVWYDKSKKVIDTNVMNPLMYFA